MNVDEIRELVHRVIIDKIGSKPEGLVPEAKLVDLGADSLDLTEIAMSIGEEIFRPGSVNEFMFEKTDTIGDIIIFVQEKLSE